MSFFRYITVLEALTMSETGSTRGQIQKLCLSETRGQIERTLRDLIGEGFVREEKIPYRPHIDMKLYHITEKAIEYCEMIVTKYDRRAKQIELNLDIRGQQITQEIIDMLNVESV